MAITLITGQPGHGKSLLAITKGLQFVAEGRPVYASGFKGLDYKATGFLPLPTPFTAFDPRNKDEQGRTMPDWQLLPHGSVIMLDECYDVLPQRAAGSKVPVHVDALARHRHHGYDIILVCQMHNQIDGFVKGLVDPHIHVRRKFGLGFAVLKTWDKFHSNTDSTDYLEAPKWRYPKRNYALYESATKHTVKRHIPWFIWAVPILLAIIVGLAWSAKRGLSSMGGATATASAGAGAPVIAGSRDGSSIKDADMALRRKDYAAWIQPRIPGQPWTAPAWDHLQPQGVPELYCIAVEDGGCTCITEQGTKYVTPANICRSIARDGVYNPFRRVAQDPGERRDAGQAAPRREAAAPVAAVDLSAGSSWPAGIGGAYIPPQQTTATGGAR